MKDETPFIKRLRHRLASLLYGTNIEQLVWAKFDEGERYGYAYAKREFLKTGKVTTMAYRGRNK